jgi:hypothetical protein
MKKAGFYKLLNSSLQFGFPIILNGLLVYIESPVDERIWYEVITLSLLCDAIT